MERSRESPPAKPTANRRTSAKPRLPNPPPIGTNPPRCRRRLPPVPPTRVVVLTCVGHRHSEWSRRLRRLLLGGSRHPRWPAALQRSGDWTLAECREPAPKAGLSHGTLRPKDSGLSRQRERLAPFPPRFPAAPRRRPLPT